MDRKDEFIQVPTLSFPAYRKAKRPIWLLILGVIGMITGIGLVIWAVMANFA